MDSSVHKAPAYAYSQSIEPSEQHRRVVFWMNHTYHVSSFLNFMHGSVSYNFKSIDVFNFFVLELDFFYLMGLFCDRNFPSIKTVIQIYDLQYVEINLYDDIGYNVFKMIS